VEIISKYDLEDIHRKDKILDVNSLYKELYSEKLQEDKQLSIRVKVVLDELPKNKRLLSSEERAALITRALNEGMVKNKLKEVKILK
jgi:hypothetical protein